MDMHKFEFPKGCNYEQVYATLSEWLVKTFGEDIFKGEPTVVVEVSGYNIYILNGIIASKENFTVESSEKLKNFLIKKGYLIEKDFKLMFLCSEFVKREDMEGYWYISYVGK
jgi:hypothetical protein